MKRLQLPQFFLISLLLLITFSACKKTDHNTSAPTIKCRLATATDNAGHMSNTFLYDDSNRLVTLVHVSDSDPYTKHLSYKGDSIISYIDAGINSSTDTIVRNKFGLIAKERQVSSPYDAVNNASFTYDANGVLTSSAVGPNSSASTTVDYTFINGDNIYQKYNSQGNIAIDTFSYYTDKPSVPVDFFQYQQDVFYGSYYLINKHLLKSYQIAPYHGEYTYDFDAHGNISTLYSDFGNAKDTLHFTYICP